MKENLKATTKRMIPILAQIVQRYLPGHKIEEFAAGEKIKARGVLLLRTGVPADARPARARVLAQRTRRPLDDILRRAQAHTRHQGREAAHGRQRGEHAAFAEF